MKALRLKNNARIFFVAKDFVGGKIPYIEEPRHQGEEWTAVQEDNLLKASTDGVYLREYALQI